MQYLLASADTRKSDFFNKHLLNKQKFQLDGRKFPQKLLLWFTPSSAAWHFPPVTFRLLYTKHAAHLAMPAKGNNRK